MSHEKRRIIIDCDPGADDAQAIVMALAADNIEIVAISTVFGNTTVENTTKNILRLLKFCNRLDIPVYKGCSTNLMMEPSSCGTYFGKDGFCDITIPGVDPIDLNQISAEHASVALCRLVAQNPGDITLVALAPLTNIAVCLKLDQDFGKKLKSCVIMGGNIQGRGNRTPAAEFNFSKDPEAAHAVLEGLQILPTLFAYETCIEYSASWDWYETFTSCGTRLSTLMKDIDSVPVGIMKSRNEPCYLIYDQLAMAAVINPEIVEEFEDVYASVELHGSQSRGLLVIDWAKKLNRVATVRIARRLDDKKCKDMLLQSVKKASF